MTIGILLTEKIQEEKYNLIEKNFKTFEKIKMTESKINERFKKNIGKYMKTFYDKSIKRLKNKKLMLDEMVFTRDNFKTNFNSNIEAEKNLLKLIKFENELTDLNQCLEYYDTIKNSNYKSDLKMKIHKIISVKKEELVLNDISKLGRNIMHKGVFIKHLEDWKKNNWIFSPETLNRLHDYAL